MIEPEWIESNFIPRYLLNLGGKPHLCTLYDLLFELGKRVTIVYKFLIDFSLFDTNFVVYFESGLRVLVVSFVEFFGMTVAIHDIIVDDKSIESKNCYNPKANEPKLQSNKQIKNLRLLIHIMN